MDLVAGELAATSTADAAAAGGCAATEATVLQAPDALVCEIIELQMDLDCKGIDYSSLKIFTDNIFKTLMLKYVRFLRCKWIWMARESITPALASRLEVQAENLF